MNDDYKDVSGLLEDDVSKVDTDEKISADEKVSVADKIDIGDKIESIKPIKPIKPIRMPKFAAMRTMAEYSIPTPVTRKEMYLYVIAGGVSALPTPITREEIYLAKICGMDVTIPIPLTRYEMYLYKLAGGEWDVPAPVTRIEKYLYHNCGFEIEVPEPITREEIYWNGGQPQPTTIEGVPPLTFTAKRTGNLEDYTIYGNSVQNGTPTPDNPIMPQGTGERTGNLFDFEQLKNAPSGTIGSITFLHVLTLQLKANTYYTMASNGTGSTSSTPADLYRSVYFNATTGESSVNKNNPVTVLTDSTGVVRIGFFSERTNAQQYLNGEAQLWINEGTEALPYEPYGYKIPISSASTTTPVYLGEVETTRQIRKLVLTGEENFILKDKPDTANYLYVLRLYHKNTIGVCSHLPYTDSYPRTFPGFRTDASMQLMYMCIGPELQEAQSGGNTVEGFRYYLAAQHAAGTPVTVWYVLATPEVGIVNEPLAKIGDYADSVNFSQAGVEIPVTTGANTLSVGTTVQPSNMSITYK